MPWILPADPNLRHLKMQVNDFIERYARNDAQTTAIARAHLTQPPQQLSRSQALHVVARQYGFESWPKLKHYVQADAERAEVEGLFDSIRHGDLQAVSHALDDDPTLIEGMTGWGMTPLYCAARWGDARSVAMLLDRGADPNARRGAAMFDCNSVASLELMLQRGGNVSISYDDHRAHRITLLHMAAFKSDEQMLRMVVARGGVAHLNARLAQGNEGRFAGDTPVQVGAKLGHRQIARALLDLGAEYDAFSAACLGDVAHLREAIKPKLAVDAPVDQYGQTLLFWAIEGNQGEVLKLLLDAGASLDRRNQFDETPLLLASTNDAGKLDHRVLVPLLLDRGAQIDALAAAAMGKTELLETYRDTLNLRNRYGWTPLHWAARNGHLQTVTALLDWGADVNAADANGWTPLFPAAYWGQRADVVQRLLDTGANALHRDRFGNDINAYDVGKDIGDVLRRRQRQITSS
jgi:ankyrin repeat protein